MGRALTVNASATTTFEGTVGGTTALASLTTDAAGTTDLNAATITTTGDQIYNDAVVLTTDVTINAANATFGGTVDGDGVMGRALTVNASATTTFEGTVGGTTALASLTSDAAGTTDLNAATITTTGDQVYNDAVVLTTDVTINAANATFGSTVDGDGVMGRALTVNASATTTFEGNVGGTTALASLTTDAAGTTDLNAASVTTTGDQTYNDAVVLTTDVTINAANATFGSTVDGDGVMGRALTVNASATTTFEGNVGGTTALASLTTDAAGTTDLNAATITTTGDQVYNDAVVLTTDVTINAPNATFGSTVDGDGVVGRALIVNATDTTFEGNVGGTIALASLTTDAAGTTDLNAATITTTGDQVYNDAVVLTTDVTINAANATFGSTVDGDGVIARSLTVVAGGNTTFVGNVGSIVPLASLTTDTPGVTEIDSPVVTTTGNLVFDDPVILTIDVTLNAANVTFNSTINGDGVAPRSLIVNANGVTTFEGIVGGIDPLNELSTDAAGQTKFVAAATGVTTLGNQRYRDPVLLMADVLFQTIGGSVTFEDVVDAADDGVANVSAWGIAVDQPLGSNLVVFEMPVGLNNQALAAMPSDPDGVEFVRVTSGTGLDITVDLLATRDIRLEVLETTPPAATDDLTVAAGVTIRNDLDDPAMGGSTAAILLIAGDDITIEPGATVLSDGLLAVEADLTGNDPLVGATIDATGLTGLLGGDAGVSFRTGPDNDSIQLHSARLAGGDSHQVEAGDGDDLITLLFAANGQLSTAAGTALTIDGGPGTDVSVLNYSLDTMSRKLVVDYLPGTTDGTDIQVSGLGTDAAFFVLDTETHDLRAGMASPDHLTIRGTGARRHDHRRWNDRSLPGRRAGMPAVDRRQRRRRDPQRYRSAGTHRGKCRQRPAQRREQHRRHHRRHRLRRTHRQ